MLCLLQLVSPVARLLTTVTMGVGDFKEVGHFEGKF